MAMLGQNRERELFFYVLNGRVEEAVFVLTWR